MAAEGSAEEFPLDRDNPRLASASKLLASVRPLLISGQAPAFLLDDDDDADVNADEDDDN